MTPYVRDLGERHAPSSAGAPRPWIDELGILRVGDRWVGLPESEWALMAILVARFGKAVATSELRAVGEDGGMITAGALNLRLSRLRRRISLLELQIINIRRRGYVLDRVRRIDDGRNGYERL